MQLSDYIGKVIHLYIPRLSKTEHQIVKLLGVEAGGIWIEHQGVINDVLQGLGIPSSLNSLAIFLPYHEIAFVMTAIAGPALDEKAFGV